MPSTNPVVHFEIQSANPEAQQQFYAQLFGWNINADNAMNYGLVQHGEGANGIGSGIGSSTDQTNRVTFYVYVDDLQASLDQAVSLGGSVAVPPMDLDLEGEKFAIAAFTDPEGNFIGLFHQ